MRIRWAPEAVEDLARLHAFLAQHDPAVAHRTVIAFGKAARGLAAHPRLGSPVPGFEPREVRRVFVGNYEMRYELAKEAIHILRFFHGREDR